MRSAIVIIPPDLEDGEELPKLFLDIRNALQRIPSLAETGKVIITIRHVADAVIAAAEEQSG